MTVVWPPNEVVHQYLRSLMTLGLDRSRFSNEGPVKSKKDRQQTRAMPFCARAHLQMSVHDRRHRVGLQTTNTHKEEETTGSAIFVHVLCSSACLCTVSGHVHHDPVFSFSRWRRQHRQSRQLSVSSRQIFTQTVSVLYVALATPTLVLLSLTAS